MDDGLCFPAVQARHVVAPVAARESVIIPAAQVAHAVVLTALNLPALQWVHVVAPVSASSLVVLPESHTVHMMVLAALYSPAGHLVQVEAPAAPCVSVVLPAAHVVQVSFLLSTDTAVLYCPGSHATHWEFCLFVGRADVNLPAGHGVCGSHVVCPSPENLPRAQASQLFPSIDSDVPAAHGPQAPAPDDAGSDMNPAAHSAQEPSDVFAADGV